MKAPTASSAVQRRSWLSGVLTATLLPLFLTACASKRPEPAGGTVDIGYGEVAEETVGGSVETVEAEEERLERTLALADMLRRLPGVQVSVRGDDLAVRIRGNSSFLASKEPLVVMDGMEFRGALGAINPFNIESITVLKNAGETAVYGSRGANGVILITTKTGAPSGGA